MNSLTPLTIDLDLGVKWYQYINSSGTNITHVEHLQTGWAVSSNSFQVGNLSVPSLKHLVDYLEEGLAMQILIP